MPIISVNGFSGGWENIIPLSSQWTYWDVATLVRIQTDQMTSVKVQDDDIRLYMNLNISHLADLLTQSTKSWYGVYIRASLEAGPHPVGLDYIDMTDTANGGVISIFGKMHTIERISIPKVTTAQGLYFGDATQMTLPQITQLRTNLNKNHWQTLAYCIHGKDILIFIGRDIGSSVNWTDLKYTALGQFVIWGYRQPLLDDMLPENTIAFQDSNKSKTYNIGGNSFSSNYIDLPDRYVKLLVDMTVKNVYQQMQLQPPAQVEQAIAQGIASIVQNTMAEKQSETKSDKPYITPVQPGGMNG
jgi:hypothetical protein